MEENTIIGDKSTHDEKPEFDFKQTPKGKNEIKTHFYLAFTLSAEYFFKMFFYKQGLKRKGTIH